MTNWFLNKKLQYYIWLIVSLQIIFPFPSEASLMSNLFSKIDTHIIKPIANAYFDNENSILPEITKSTTNPPTYTANSLGMIEIPIAIDSLNSGSEICIGEIPDIRNASKIYYNTQSKSGGSLYIGMRTASKTDIGTRWFHYIGSGTGTVIWESKDLIRYNTEYTGNYSVYIQSKYGTCTNISGSIKIEYDK